MFGKLPKSFIQGESMKTGNELMECELLKGGFHKNMLAKNTETLFNS
jgi:hypothetical protein